MVGARRCPSASGRSTSIGSTRTSASSSRSSSRRCSTATSRRGGRVLDPFAGSGTTLVQSLECGLRRDRCRHRRVQLPAHGASRRGATTSFALERELRDVVRARRGVRGAPRAAASAVRRATGTRRGRPRELLALPRADRRVRARATCSACARARRPVGAPHDALRPRLPARAADGASTGATSTSAIAGPSSGRAASSAATRSTRSRGSRSSRACAREGARRRSSTATRARSSYGGRFDAVLTSPPYPGLIDYHEQHRYAYELLGPRRPARARARRRGARDERRAAIDGVRRRHRGCARARAAVAAAGRAGPHRRQRPARPLSRRSSSARACGSRTGCAAT